MIYTSNFKKSGTNNKAISIALSAPYWYKGHKMPALYPTWDIVNNYKNGFITKEQYKQEYGALLYTRGIKITKMIPDEAILLCWEDEGYFCHRHFIANWLNANGIKTMEI